MQLNRQVAKNKAENFYHRGSTKKEMRRTPTLALPRLQGRENSFEGLKVLIRGIDDAVDGLSRAFVQWYCEPEGCTHAFFAFDFDDTTVHTDQVAGDDQA